MGPAFPDLVGRAYEPARPEGLFVDCFYFSVVRRRFRQVNYVGKAHGLCVPVEGKDCCTRQRSPISAFRRGRPFVVGRTG